MPFTWGQLLGGSELPLLGLRGAVPVASPLIPGAKGATPGCFSHPALSLVLSVRGVTASLGSVTCALGRDSPMPKERRRTRHRDRRSQSRGRRSRSQGGRRRRGSRHRNPSTSPCRASRPARDSPRPRSVPNLASDLTRFEPALRDLVCDKPEGFVHWLAGTGIETCMDLRAVWGSGHRLVEEFEAECGRLPADDAINISMIFTLAGKQARDHQLSVVRAVVMDRQSSRPDHPALTLEANPSSASSATRRVLTTGFVGPATVLATCARQDPQCREEEVKAAKLSALFQLLAEEFLDFQELGIDPQVLADPRNRESLQASVMKGASRLGVQRLGTLTSSLRRWRRWALQKDIPPSKPGALQVAEFLREVARGGPTAAASMFHVMRWFEEGMGLNFHTTHFMVKPYRMHEAHHTGTQAVELSPSELLNLLHMVRRAQGSYMVVLTFMIQSAVSCVRFEHIQRSRLIMAHDGWLEFECSKGKSRRKGARPAYRWATPEVLFQGWSLCSTLQDFLLHECLPDASYLWPALQLRPEELWELTDVTPFEATKPMSRSRFLELLRGALSEMGTPHADASSAGYNRLRRFLPTLGNCLKLHRTEMQAIGNWQEIPCGGGPQPTTKERAVMDMSLHYAGQKVFRSAQTKRASMARFFALYRRKASELALTGGGFLAPTAWTWPELCTMNGEFGEVKIDVVEPVDDDLALVGNDVAPAELPIRHTNAVSSSESEAPDPAAVDAVVESSGGEDSSSSASDVSAIPEELVGILAEEELNSNLKWLQQGKKVHIVKAVPHEGRQVPWCRDSPFIQDPAKTGDGFDRISKSEICQRCLARLPRAVYVALADHCGWIH